MCKLLEDIKVPPEYTDVDVTRWPVKSLAESLRPHAADEEVQERPPINEEGEICFFVKLVPFGFPLTLFFVYCVQPMLTYFIYSATIDTLD